MRDVLMRAGKELSDIVEQFAPLTRPKRVSGDITASSLIVGVDRLLLLIGRDALDDEARGRAEEYATRIQVEARTWLTRGAHRDDEKSLALLVIERADVLVRLLHQQRTPLASASR